MMFLVQLLSESVWLCIALKTHASVAHTQARMTVTATT